MLPALMGTTPFAVLLCFWSARRIPRDLLDAARLDGLGPLAIWWRVAVPLTRPTLVAVAAIVFAAHWGNFVDALLYLYSPQNFTLPLGMSQLRLLGPTDSATVLAGARRRHAPAVAGLRAGAVAVSSRRPGRPDGSDADRAAARADAGGLRQRRREHDGDDRGRRRP